MDIEHLGMNLAGAADMVAWYREHLGMPVHVEQTEPVYVAFFGEGPTLLEVYDNPEVPYFDPSALSPRAFHLAFHSRDLFGDRDRLVQAGAKAFADESDPDGHGLLMLVCPWGLPLQLAHRREPLIQP